MDEHREPTPTWLDLYDYRHRVATMYRERERALRAGEDEQVVLQRFRAHKDALFAHHPQSALSPEARRSFSGLKYFAYNPALRLEALLEPVIEPEDIDQGPDLPASGPHTLNFHNAARLRFAVEDLVLELVVYWIDVYGGGLFLPFRDTTCPSESYASGRYLFDTVKGSDFTRVDDDEGNAHGGKRTPGYAGGRVILDFNYAYNPSCAYDARWACPLAPRENHLPVPIRAGERKFHE
jgi:uncharacterized protein